MPLNELKSAPLTAPQLDDANTSTADASSADASSAVPAPQSAPAPNFNDRNAIAVTISNKQAPLVILYGPPACGKTMTMVRLTRFLHKKGYDIQPDTTFRHSSDSRYKERCDQFSGAIQSDLAAESTANIDFMLIKVCRNSRTICQILEAPGEGYFDPQYPRQDYPSYVHQILSSPNRKIWAIFLEPEWMDASDRNNYVSRVSQLATMMQPKDKVLFIYNKVDKTNCVVRNGLVRKGAVLERAMQQYENMFEPFRNTIPVIKWFRPWNCGFVPFQTGSYTELEAGGMKYNESSDRYCDPLWDALQSIIRG